VVLSTEMRGEGWRGKERRGKRGHVSCDGNYHFCLQGGTNAGNDWVKVGSS